ncbi:hypothetical protein D3C79_1005640 [compost metagenome]
MNQRITDFIDNSAVQLRLGAGNNQVDFFVQGFGKVTDHAREPVEHGIHRDHAQLHDNILQISADPAHMFYRFRQIGILNF